MEAHEIRSAVDDIGEVAPRNHAESLSATDALLRDLAGISDELAAGDAEDQVEAGCLSCS